MVKKGRIICYLNALGVFERYKELKQLEAEKRDSLLFGDAVKGPDLFVTSCLLSDSLIFLNRFRCFIASFMIQVNANRTVSELF